MEFPEIKEGVVVHPGDTVILTLHEGYSLTPEQVEDYMRRIRAVMPPHVEVILTVGAEVKVIRGEPRSREVHARNEPFWRWR